MWENEKPEDKNMESLRHEFGIENLVGSTVLTEAPNVDDLKELEERFVDLSGTLFRYIRYNGVLFKQTYTAV